MSDIGEVNTGEIDDKMYFNKKNLTPKAVVPKRHVEPVEKKIDRQTVQKVLGVNNVEQVSPEQVAALSEVPENETQSELAEIVQNPERNTINGKELIKLIEKGGTNTEWLVLAYHQIDILVYNHHREEAINAIITELIKTGEAETALRIKELNQQELQTKALGQIKDRLDFISDDMSQLANK